MRAGRQHPRHRQPTKRNVMDGQKNTTGEWKSQLIRGETRRQAIRELEKHPEAELAEILQSIDIELLVDVLPLFSAEKQGLVFAAFDMTNRLHLFRRVSKKWFASLFEQMPSDSRADIFQHFSTQERVNLLPYLSKSTREDVLRLSTYPHDTAGGIMSTNFAIIKEKQTCEQAIQEIRKEVPREKMLYHLYVVDEDMHLIGYMSLKDLVIAEPNELVTAIMQTEFATASLDEDRESVAKKIEKYDTIALPVVNENNQLMGIVHHDDAIEVIRAEQTEDMEKFMGIIPGDEVLNYNQTTVLGHFRKRVIWLAILTVVGFVSGMIIQRYEDALSALMILALYIPMIADTGGNSGSQAATVVIRAMALGQVNINNWMAILFKEMRISALLAAVLALIAFFLILILSWESDTTLNHSLGFIAFGISAALAFQIITSTIIGAGLPLLVNRFGGDPAVAASPAITTIVDISGLLIYFGVATLLFF